MQMCREEVSRKGKNKHKVPSGGPWWTVRETGSSGAMEGEDKQRGGPEVRGRSSAPRGDCGGGAGRRGTGCLRLLRWEQSAAGEARSGAQGGEGCAVRPGHGGNPGKGAGSALWNTLRRELVGVC